MAIDEQEFKRLKRRAMAARAARDKAAGQLEAAMERLESEFGCATIAAAEKEAARLEREAVKAEGVFNKAVATFEEEWDERLDEED